MPPAIRVENLGKEYLLGEFERYNTLRETIARAVTRPALRLARGLRSVLLPAPRSQPPAPGSESPAPGSPLPAPCSEAPARRAGPETIWALRDVSFEVQHGEVLGIIGPNGAGKSTLLKILSRITEPTTGYAEIRGRVGSLLEVGTGFHPELTGRENVYLNGAILGMSKAEIRRKFDDIVSFAGVEKFIDTPVKRYSSGMQVRLAFAVAAHLDPEILIIDEVLAVGDAEFQRRCLGKMDKVARSGRTILFVSHNLAAVQSLCTVVALMENGAIANWGDPTEAVARYLRPVSPVAHGPIWHTPGPVIRSIALMRKDGTLTTCFRLGETILVRVQGMAPEPLPAAVLCIRLLCPDGTRLSTWISSHQYPRPITLHRAFELTCSVSNIRLFPQTYLLEVHLGSSGRTLEVHKPLSFTIVPTAENQSTRQLTIRAGIYVPHVTWNLSHRASRCDCS